MRKVPLIYLFLCTIFNTLGQVQIVQQNTIGYRKNNIDSYSFFENSGKKFLTQIPEAGIGDDKTIEGFGGNDGWLIEINDDYSIKNQSLFGGDGFDAIVKVSFFSNGDQILLFQTISGQSGSFISSSYGSYDIVMLRLGSDGQIVWQKRYGGSLFERPWDIVMLPNDEFIVVSTSDSPISGNKTEDIYSNSDDLWLIRLDAFGNEVWQKNYGGLDSEFVSRGLYFNDRVYVAVTSESPISGNKTAPLYGEQNVWLLKLDLQGNLLQEITLGGSEREQLKDFTIMNDKLLVSMLSSSPPSGTKDALYVGGIDSWLVQLDTNFTILNQFTFGGLENDVGAEMEVKNDYLYLSISSNSSATGNKTVSSFGDYDNWLICMDTNFVEQYQYSLGGSKEELPVAVYQKERGVLEIVSVSNSNVSGNKAVATYNGQDSHWLVKLDVPLAILETTNPYSFSAYPNPFMSTFTIELGENHSFESLEILDSSGRKVWIADVTKKSTIKTEALEILETGSYIYRLSGPQTNFVGKIIKGTSK